jgi:hypothetical protein
VGQDDDGDPGAVFLHLGHGNGTFEPNGLETFRARRCLYICAGRLTGRSLRYGMGETALVTPDAVVVPPTASCVDETRRATLLHRSCRRHGAHVPGNFPHALAQFRMRSVETEIAI